MTELLKKEDELDGRANEQAAQFRDASQSEKDKIKKQIEETVNKQFDVRQQRRRLKLDRMQKELEQLRAEIDGRDGKREKIVKGRVQELLGEGGPGF